MGFLVKSEKIANPNSNTDANSDAASGKKKMTRGLLGTRSVRSQDVVPIQSVESQDTYKSKKSETSKYIAATGSVQKLSLKERIRAARKRGMRGDVYDLQFLVEEGPLSFRSFAFIGGFFMILASALDFVETDEDPVARLITYNLWLAGFIIIQVEGRPFHVQVPFLYDCICLFFSFLRYVWGRGFLYFLAGCFQFFLFTKYNMIAGVYFMLLGAFSIVFGYKASVRLAGLRNSIQSREEIRFMFHSFDKDRDGYLNAEEFRELLMAMDQNLEHNDFVAAMSAVDMENNQMVSYQDLEAWWTGYNDDELPPGSACMTYSRGLKNNPNAHLMT